MIGDPLSNKLTAGPITSGGTTMTITYGPVGGPSIQQRTGNRKQRRAHAARQRRLK